MFIVAHDTTDDESFTHDVIAATQGNGPASPTYSRANWSPQHVLDELRARLPDGVAAVSA